MRKLIVWRKQGESGGRKKLHPEKWMGLRIIAESLSLDLNCETVMSLPDLDKTTLTLK